jgi:hypothetical protein
MLARGRSDIVKVLDIGDKGPFPMLCFGRRNGNSRSGVDITAQAQCSSSASSFIASFNGEKMRRLQLPRN